jgi:hypothetical protein
VQPKQLPDAGFYALTPRRFGTAFDQQIADARAVWDCPAIRRLRQSYTSKLTVGRFLSNIVDSFTNTRLRIPPDPEDAYQKFCGGNSPTALGFPHASTFASGLVAVSSRRVGVGRVGRTVRDESARVHEPAASLPNHVVSLAGFV